MSEYERWLEETIAHYKRQALRECRDMGYPGKIRYAHDFTRASLEAFEEALQEYRAFVKANPKSS